MVIKWYLRIPLFNNEFCRAKPIYWLQLAIRYPPVLLGPWEEREILVTCATSFQMTALVLGDWQLR